MARPVLWMGAQIRRLTVITEGNSMKAKIYVGYSVDGTGYAIFKSEIGPSIASHGHLYRYVVGPFVTLRGAEFFAQYGRGNPHIQTVADAERIAKAASHPTGW